MTRRLSILLALLLAFFTISATAQSNELAVTAGGYFPFNTSFSADTSFAVGGSFAHRVAGVPLVSLYVELPVYASFNSTATLKTVTSPANAKYSALFITPGVKLKLAPEFPVSPYAVFGGGLAHYSKTNTGTNDSNASTFDIGGGLDFKVAPFLSLRGEVRDFYSGNAHIFQNVDERQHQVMATAGLVLRF